MRHEALSLAALLSLLVAPIIAPWQKSQQNERLVLDVQFESSKDYDITSAYAVRGWNTTEGRMKITVPTQQAKHGGRYGMQVAIVQAFTKNFHAQFSLPHFMPRMDHSAYKLTFWAKVDTNVPITPEVAFLDVDEGYEWVGGATLSLTSQWQHIAMEYVYTLPSHKGHEIQIAFLIGAGVCTFYFDDIQLYEADVPSPPPPSPPPPPNYLLWIDGEGGPKGVQTVTRAGTEGVMKHDLSSSAAAHTGSYGFEVTVSKVYEKDYHCMLSLPAFLVTDHERMYTLAFWAKVPIGEPGAPKPRPHVTFQDEDNDYAWISGEFVQLSAIWHRYEVNLVVPYTLRGHNVITNFMLGSQTGTYYFDDFEVTNRLFVSPPPSPPLPPPSPPPNVLLMLTLEDYVKGTVNPQAWPEGTMEVVVQSQAAAHSGKYGLMIKSSETQLGTEVVQLSHSDWQMHYVVVDLKTEHVGHSIRPFLYVGEHRAIYHFDEFEYKEIEIEDGMQWLQAAPERIRHHRMGRFSVSFRDTDDWPIDYGSARIELQRHEFPFGVNLRTRRESGLTSTDYVWYLTQAAKLFWSGTIRQQMQWHEYEPAPGDVAASKREVSELLTWMSRQGWAAGSTSLFDGGHEAKDHWSNKLTCADLELHLRERLMRDLREGSGFGKKFARYEVWRDAMKHREWIMRCGESILFNSYRWAHQADSAAKLITSESDILSTQTLTNAEAYHNMVWEMKHNRDVPVGGIGVRACFRGEVDASTVKHRLDVLHEVQLPVYITDLSISGLDPAKHAYELEKFLRIAFSHPAVAGITLGDLWDKGNPEGNPGAGLYSSTKQKKPAAAKLEQLWGSEWTTSLDEGLHAAGTLEFEGFYGTYKYALRSGMRECAGEISLEQTEESKAPDYYAPVGGGPERSLVLRCNWKGHVHVPVWATPAIIAFLFVGCLLGCYRKNAEHMAAQREARDREMARTPDRAERGRSGGTKALKGRTGPARITVRT